MTAYDDHLDDYGDPGPVTVPWQVGMEYVLDDVRSERARQREKWGDDTTNDHPDGTGPDGDMVDDIGYFPGEGNGWLMQCAQDRTDALGSVPGRVTWAHILTEEWAEAMVEADPVALRAELVQVAAVAVKWIEAIDRREASRG